MTERKLVSSQVDFHVHYREEDSKEVIEEAKRCGLVGLGLISKIHVPDDIGQSIAYGQEIGVEVIQGVEKLCRSEGEPIDVIALGFDYSNPTFRQIFGKDETLENGKRIASSQKQLFEAQGFTFEGLGEERERVLEELLSGRVSEKAIRFCELIASNVRNDEKVASVKEQNSANWVRVSDNYAERLAYRENPYMLEAKFLWEVYCRPGKACYIDTTREVSEVISTVHIAGGVVLYSPEGKFQEKMWQRLIEAGIDGIMAWHGGEIELGKDVVLEARKRELLVLGGSDYNPSTKEWRIGDGNGKLFISPRRLRELKSYLQKRQNKAA